VFIGAKSKSAHDDTGMRIRALRKRCGLSMRELALRSELSPALISYAERGVTSMSLVTLEKVLTALGTSITEFFSEGDSSDQGPIFSREKMHVVSDADRTYTLLFARGVGGHVEMADEHIRPSAVKPNFTRLKNDIAGYLLSGTLILEIKGEDKRTLRPGDAFYLPRNISHRGYAAGDEEVRLITASHFCST
jgi:transcriptional regulator with XRE-family HTH domain